MTRSTRKDSSCQDSQSQENVSSLLVLPQTDGKQILHNKELPKDCYKVLVDDSLVDAACIPDVGNNSFKTVKDAVGSFFAWPKDQVVFNPKATPPSTIQMNVENKTTPKLQKKCKNVYVSSDAIQRQAKKMSLQKFGVNKWYQSFALRNFDLQDMEFESTNSGTTAKLPILKLGEYEIWVIKIKQYFQIQDYALWEVIENGDSWVSVPQTTQENGTSVTKMSILVTAEEKTNKKNDVTYPDAKSMFDAIETRFRGNAATKKTQKTLLKQQYENFSASSVESLDSIFNRLQKIVSRLAILGVVIAQEDLNLKILSSLPPEWNTHVVVWMNKPEIKTMSIDDLYNNLKIIEQKVKKSIGISSGAQNLAFMNAPSTSNTNNANTASLQVSAASPNVNVVIPQDLEKIQEDDLEAIDLKWQLSLLSVRAKKECRAPRSKEGQFRNQDNIWKQGNNEDTSSKAMLAIDGVGFD
ncbi:hypothetical protein Tco_0709267 [Tanacetum coccineum]